MPIPNDNSKIAIIGMNAQLGSNSLDAFERSIYEGQLADRQDNIELSTAEMLARFDRTATVTLEDARLNSDTNIAKIIVSDRPQLDRNVTIANSIFEALLTAQKLLNERVETVLVAGIDFARQGIGVVVLKRYEAAKRDRHKIYAAIDTLNINTAIDTQNVAYLELVGEKPLEEIEIEQIPVATNAIHSCAVSSVVNTGYQGIAGSIAGLIKTALCLYYRYIPPVPQWQQSTAKSSPFYVAPYAKPWFLEAGVNQRVAAINFVSDNSTIILSEEIETQQRGNSYLEQTPCYLFPLAANDSETLLEQIHHLKQSIEAGDLAKIAKKTFIDRQHGEYALAIVGKNKPEILKECDRAIKGIAKAFETGKDWQTPVGSYFTAHPQGKLGKVAFVYPGAYNAHVGLGKDLFRLFPNLIDDPVIKSTCNRTANIEKLLYPRSWHKLAPRELESKERQLMNDALAMLESETGFAGFMTTILRDYFQVKPQAAFGYSLGETSMMYAQGVWGDIDRSSDVLNASPLFKTRLAGRKEAVREYWQLTHEPKELWRTYVVMANSDAIKEKLKSENRVYLTQISTPREAIIAGDPQSCERVIASLGCDAFRAPFNHVIHCEAMKSEYNRLIELNTLPLRKSPELTFYSAANYQTIDCNRQEIAHSLTQTLCQQLDFPRLVNRVYQDNYRIFIEVGVGSNCSRWIKDILKSQEHAVVSLHRRGTNDFVALIKAIAKLWSHRVKLDLTPLYGAVAGSTQNKPAAHPARNNEPVDPWQESAKPIQYYDIAEIPQSKIPLSFSNSNKVVAISSPFPARNTTKEQSIRSENLYFGSNKTDGDRPEFSHEVRATINNKSSLTINITEHESNRCKPTYLDSLKDGFIRNNDRVSQAHSIFIKHDSEFIANNMQAVYTYMKVLEQAIDKK